MTRTNATKAAAARRVITNDWNISRRDAEIAAAQAELDLAMATARQAKINLDRATKRAQLVALRDIGAIMENDEFDETENPKDHPYEHD